MGTPHQYLEDLRPTVAALAASQGLPAAEMEQTLRRYPESVGLFLVLAFEAAEAAGFADAFRLVDCIENLGCQHLRIANPARQDTVEVFLHRPNGAPATVRLDRAALNVSRTQLIQVLKQQLDLIDESTIMMAAIRPRGAPPPARSPKDAEAEDLLRQAGRSADELLGLEGGDAQPDAPAE